MVAILIATQCSAVQTNVYRTIIFCGFATAADPEGDARGGLVRGRPGRPGKTRGGDFGGSGTENGAEIGFDFSPKDQLARFGNSSLTENGWRSGLIRVRKARLGGDPGCAGEGGVGSRILRFGMSRWGRAGIPDPGVRDVGGGGGRSRILGFGMSGGKGGRGGVPPNLRHPYAGS